MKVIGQLVRHFYAAGLLTTEQRHRLVASGFVLAYDVGFLDAKPDEEDCESCSSPSSPSFDPVSSALESMQENMALSEEKKGERKPSKNWRQRSPRRQFSQLVDLARSQRARS